MSDTDIYWFLKFYSSQNFLFSFSFEISFFLRFIHFFLLRFHIFEILFFFGISFFLILFISWYYLTLTLPRSWHYLNVTLIRSWLFLTLTLCDTEIDWVLNFFFFSFFFFYEVSIFLIFFLIWKKIKETNKNLNKRSSCSLSKQWLMHQQLLSYCRGKSKIYKKFDFKAKGSDLEKPLFNSGSGIFTQYYMILSMVCFFCLVKTVCLLK